MLSVAVRPSAMKADTVAVLVGAVPNVTRRPVSVAGLAPVVNSCAASQELKVCVPLRAVCPVLLNRSAAEAAPAPSSAGTTNTAAKESSAPAAAPPIRALRVRLRRRRRG